MTTRIASDQTYDLPARRISGTHDEKLDQIDAAIQELLDLKRLECAADEPGVWFLAGRKRGHALAMTVAILALLIVLVLVLRVHPSFA